MRFAAQQPALFDVTFYAGLDKARHPELAVAGDAVLATVLLGAGRPPPTSRPHSTCCCGWRRPLTGWPFSCGRACSGSTGDILDETADRAARTARAIVADLNR